MINTGSGAIWLPMTAQGAFSGFDEFVCSQMVSFAIGNTGLETFNMVRSSSSGEGTVNVTLVGNTMASTP